MIDLVRKLFGLRDASKAAAAQNTAGNGKPGAQN